MAEKKERQLVEKAVDIKGKSYVLVSDRISFFNDTYENGSIVTERISPVGSNVEEFKAYVTPDVDKPQRTFVGHSQAKWGEGMVNKTSAMENAETSAVGRALAMMGIGVIDSVASVDEMNKAGATGKPRTDYSSRFPKPPFKARATNFQIFKIEAYAEKHGKTLEETLKAFGTTRQELSKAKANNIILRIERKESEKKD